MGTKTLVLDLKCGLARTCQSLLFFNKKCNLKNFPSGKQKVMHLGFKVQANKENAGIVSDVKKDLIK